MKKPGKKRRGLQSWRTEALRHFQKCRRLQESSNGIAFCISCGSFDHWKNMDGGHYIPRTVRVTELDPDNVYPQCKQCNGFQEGNSVAYRIELIKRIGIHRVERLENLRMAAQGSDEYFDKLSDEDKRLIVQKKTAQDYEEISKYYSKECKRLERG